ncbi:MAG: efflux RND transporter permease subunit [bacterium]
MRGGGLPGLAIARPVTVAMTLAALLVVGFIAFRLLPVQLLPSGFDPPFMWVQIPTLPTAPADNERAVALPIEDGLGTLPGLTQQRTFVRADSVGFMLQLSNDVDLDDAYEQVRDRLDRALPTLPSGARFAYIWRHDPNARPIAVYGLTYPEGTEDPHYVLQDRIGRALERIPGVSQIEVWGVADRYVRIEIDDAAARSHRVDTAVLVQKLETDNFTLALGAVEPGGRRMLVRAVQRFDDLETIRRLPVADGVVLGDIARVFFGPDPEPIIHRLDGRAAASIALYKEASANTVATSAAVGDELRRLLAAEPDLEGWRAERFFDQGAMIEVSIEQLQRSALYGGLIAVVLLFAFLRSVGLTLLVALAIPLCLLATVVVLFFLGDSLNVMSMMGLMLSVGMVIDNAIVVLENIDRHRRLGDPAPAVAGAREVSLAITLATLTSMVVFLPMVLLGDHPMIQFYLGKIGFPVCYALIASLFVALVYIPAGAHALARRVRTAQKPLGPIFRRFQALYARLLDWTLAHRTAAVLLTVAAIASTSIPFGKVERVDQLEGDLDSIDVRVQAPLQADIERVDRVLRILEERLLAEKDVLDLRAILTSKGWRPGQYTVELFLKDPDQRTVEREVITKRLEELFPQRPGYEFKIGWSRGGGGEGGGIALMLTGPDTQVATALAREVITHLERIPAVRQAEIEEDEETIELQFQVDLGQAERAGLSAWAIGSTLDYTLRGRRLGEFHTDERPVQLKIEMAPADRTDVAQVAQMPVGAPQMGGFTARPDAAVDDAATAVMPSGLAVPTAEIGTPIGLVARPVLAPGYGQIRREDRRSAVTIRIIGDEQALFGELQRVVAGLTMPTGYRVDLGARFRSRDENEEGGAFALLMAVAMVFFIMGVLFESFILPFSILLTIPLAFCGVFWTLYLSGTPLDIMAIVGCIILVGVVVNNGIVLIDQVQHRRASGETRTEALVGAGRDRVRPILMTALTTIGGLVPMAVGNASLLGIEYAPLGRVVIGGLLTGTVLTLFAVPLLYALLDDARHLPRRARLVLAGRRAPPPSEAEA